MSLPGVKQPFVDGSVETPVGIVPGVSNRLTRDDRLGGILVRWGIGRMGYQVEPGVYARGTPNDRSPVLVTANYKLSFDRLREALPGTDAWILVLDTHGVNVWCSAGKGTFGTTELVRQVEASGLERLVSHRELILPQLAGPGVAAHQVKRQCGFKVIYGPVNASDIPAFLAAGSRATPEMRRKTFPARDRAVLIPVELMEALKWTAIVGPILFLLGGLGGPAGFWANATHYGAFAVIALLCAVFAGAVLTPLLLPWLPGRAFSLKGSVMGLVVAVAIGLFRTGDIHTMQGLLEVLGWFVLIPAISAFLAMNFTGASTYTSLSGVKKEMRWAVPMEIGVGALGLCLWMGSRIMA